MGVIQRSDDSPKRGHSCQDHGRGQPEIGRGGDIRQTNDPYFRGDKGIALRAVQFKKERGRVLGVTSSDAWGRRMAEGAAVFMCFNAD